LVPALLTVLRRPHRSNVSILSVGELSHMNDTFFVGRDMLSLMDWLDWPRPIVCKGQKLGPLIFLLLS